MKTTKKGKTVTIELSDEEACVLVATLGGTRNGPMIELQERLIGSPRWKFKHQPHEAHPGRARSRSLRRDCREVRLMNAADHSAVERYVAVLRKLRDARGEAAERLFRRAEAMFFVMDGATAAAAVRAARAEGLDL